MRGEYSRHTITNSCPLEMQQWAHVLINAQYKIVLKVLKSEWAWDGTPIKILMFKSINIMKKLKTEISIGLYLGNS
jgi:hypothetical protein